MQLNLFLLLESAHQLEWLSNESVDHVHGSQSHQPNQVAVMCVDLLKVADKQLHQGGGGEIRGIYKSEDGLHLLPDREACLHLMRRVGLGSEDLGEAG